MTDTFFNQQSSHKQPLVAMYIDLQNVNKIPESAKELLIFANSKGRLIVNNIYYNSQCKNQASAKKDLSTEFKWINVPCPLKNSADNQLKSDVLDAIHSNYPPDIVILVSGDKDFVNLVKQLKKDGIKVIILAQFGSVKQELKESADEFYLVENLDDLVSVGIPPHPLTSVQVQISYDDTKECLIEAINIARKQGNPATISLVGKLMRNNQHFPNYQGVSSIRKSDDGKFSRFSKFIEAVVKDGKVRIENGQLFLVESNKLAA